MAWDFATEPEFEEQLVLGEHCGGVPPVPVVAQRAGEVADEVRFVLARDAALMRLLVRDGERFRRRRRVRVVAGLAGPREVEAGQLQMAEDPAPRKPLRPPA